MRYEMSYPKDHMAAQPAPKHVVRDGTRHAKRRPPQSPPFDPADLTRRLHVVLAERQAFAERKLRARIEAERRAAQSPEHQKSRQRHSASSKTSSSQSRDQPLQRQRSGRTGHEQPRDQARLQKLHRPSSRNFVSGGKEVDDSDVPSYHHVPSVAATQFSRTTANDATVEKNLAHKLSRVALKFHRDGPNASEQVAALDPSASPSVQAKALRRARSQRDRQYDRNQFQHPAILESAAEADVHQARKANRHTVDFYFRRGDEKEDKTLRRVSAGSVLRKSDGARESAEMPAGMVPVERLDSYGDGDWVGNPGDHRVDWTQSDERMVESRPTSPRLRKPDSRWTLRGKLGSFSKQSKEKRLSQTQGGVVPEEPSLKSPKSGFFARLKR